MGRLTPIGESRVDPSGSPPVGPEPAWSIAR